VLQFTILPRYGVIILSLIINITIVFIINGIIILFYIIDCVLFYAINIINELLIILISYLIFSTNFNFYCDYDYSVRIIHPYKDISRIFNNPSFFFIDIILSYCSFNIVTDCVQYCKKIPLICIEIVFQVDTYLSISIYEQMQIQKLSKYFNTNTY